MSTIVRNFLKCPITCCEYFNGNILIGYGPYLSLIDDVTFEEISKSLVLKYRVIHKLVINGDHSEKLICVFGQKCFCIVRQMNNNEFVNIFDKLVELDDWVFDIYWLKLNDKEHWEKSFNLLIACAHNQCLTFSLNEKKVISTSFCEQKCMLYSAKFIDVNEKRDKKNLLIGSGTIFNQILLWSVNNGRILATLNGHQGVIFSLDYSSNENLLFSTSDDRSVNVWKLDKDESNQISNTHLLTRFYGHDARVWKCCNFIDEKTKIQYLCSIGEDLNCCLWNVTEKELAYRFNAMRKGSKNIWSLCLNQNKMELITGWGDGGLRKFALKSYLKKNEIENYNLKCKEDLTEWSLITEVKSDFIRSILFVTEKIVCITNLGYLYLIDSNSNSLARDEQRQRLLFKNDLLAKYNVMTKLKIDHDTWILALGTIKGFLFLVTLKNKLQFTDNTTMESIDLLSNERDLMPLESFSGNSSKICSLMWSSFKETKKHRYFLLVCFSFLDGLMHLYEWDQDLNKIILVSRLNLPQSKHRWLVSFSIILNRVDLRETIYLTGGDKCGNLHFYIIEKNDINLLQPVQSINNLTNENASISSIYSKCCSRTNSQLFFHYLIICCSKDGYYRIFEFNSENLNELFDESSFESLAAYGRTQIQEPLKLINKCQINSYIDIIESFLFEEISNDERDSIDDTNGFNLENDLSKAICFYGDKFLLWDFQFSRALFEHTCGGSHRSWDYEFCSKENDMLFRFIYIKNKTIGEARKILERNEASNFNCKKFSNLSQVFHGNTMTKCKYFKWDNYLFSGSEDTQLILNRIVTSSENKLSIDHQFHLQGHDSAVKCFDYCNINEKEIILVSAGGKANIKIWKVSLAKDSNSIEKIVHLYEFKRLIRKKINQNEKPWLYVDIQSNPEIRFMDVVICENFERKNSLKNFVLAFACSDGFVRIFRYDLEENKLYLLNKYEYNKCLFCIKHLKLVKQNTKISYLICFGTDGKLLKWKLNIDETKFTEFQKIDNLHQSGINGVDVWEECIGSGKYMIATVGDDTRISVLHIDLNIDEIEKNSKIIKLEMAHASNIVDCKFLSKEVLSSVAKDQRLIIWKINYELERLESMQTIFVNVPDISSMDVFKLENGMFRFSIVGMGIEIIELKLN